MKYKTTLTLSVLTVTLMGCQMAGEYALMGGKQTLDSSDSYSIKNDLNQIIDTSPDGMKSKDEFSSSGFSQSPGTAYITMYLKKLTD
jgi:hypothetical protein